jgi:hypothetical protein
MYFQSFPYTLYTLDDTDTVQLVTNITTRIKINDEVKNNLSLFDKYDVRDGESPELVADKFYNNPQLHWIVLQYNDIIDPRFDWPLSTNDLNQYAAGKYNSVNATHHFEDNSGNYTNGNVYLMSSNAFVNFNINDAITNNTNTGVGYITQKISSSNVRVTVTTGGFISGDQILKSANTNISANITSTVIISGTPVTNLVYEDTVNESKRKIKILKPAYVNGLVQDFKRKLES